LIQYSKIDVLARGKKPQDFIGFMLRGALGYSLKKVTCINPSFVCDKCFAATNCLYYSFYEEKNVYHKFRFEFPPKSDLLEFSLYLYENELEKLPYLISAIYKMLHENGLGKERIKPKEFFFYVNDKMIYDGKNFQVPKNYVNRFNVEEYHKDMVLNLQSPLRLKKDNRLVGVKEFAIDSLLNSIYQRYLQLTGKQSSKLCFIPNYEIDNIDLRWKQLTRYSSRQKTLMKMDGLIGKIVLKNVDKESYKLLKLGEIIGAGKQTVMGLGKIEVKDLHE